MKYILSLLITLMIVLPNIATAQSDLQAEVEEKVRERTERQREARNEMREKRDKIRAEARQRAAETRERVRERQTERAREQRERAREIRDRVRSRNHDSSCNECPTNAFLGIESNSVSKSKAEKLGFDNPHGSYVTKVINNTAAQKAGIQPFDYIYGIDSHRTSESDNLTDLLRKYETGKSVTVHYIRKGQKQSAKLTLGSREDAKWDDYKKEKAFLGISHMASSSSCEDKPNGVKVNVVNNSTAMAMGLENGDVITEINGNTIIDWDDISTSINNITPGENVRVEFVRNGQPGTASSTIKSYSQTKEKNYAQAKPKPKYEKPEWEKPKPKKEAHQYAFFGVYTEDISKEKAAKLGCDNPYGSYVTGVIPGTAAEKAGIGPMDYIYGFDEYRTGDHQSLTGILKKFAPGDRAVVHYVRHGKKTNSDVTFGSKQNVKETPKKVKKDKCEDTFFGITHAGYGNGNGVKVNVVKNSTAAEMKIQNGDVILTINDYIMTDWDDITMALDMMNPGEKITVGYDHQGTTTRMCVPIKSYAETKNCKDCNCNEYVYNKKDHDHDYKSDHKHDNYVKADPWGDVSEGRIDLSDVDVRMSEVSGDILTPKGAGISSSNNLKVDDLDLDADEDKGLFQLEFDLPTNGPTVVRVYNNSGRVIYDYDLGMFSGEFEDNIDLAQNGTGDYFLHITQGSKSLTRKIELRRD